MQRRAYFYLLIFCLLLLPKHASADISSILGLSKEPQTTILFIGNSYTEANDLPSMLATLAKSSGTEIEVDKVTGGGWTLDQHSKSQATLDKIKSKKWSFVVLQEQSLIPAVAASRNMMMYPAARTLVAKIKENGSTPVFFVTWARRDGSPEYNFRDYESMQEEINKGYEQITNETHAIAVPVGKAWAWVHQQRPALQLWQGDGSHPSTLGTYLAACVFYSTLFQKSPMGKWNPDNLTSNDAQFLQQALTK